MRLLNAKLLRGHNSSFSEVAMHTGSYINGQWIHPRSNRLVRNINPADPDDEIGRAHV